MEAAKQGIAASTHKTQTSLARTMFKGAIGATVLFIAWGIIKMIM